MLLLLSTGTIPPSLPTITSTKEMGNVVGKYAFFSNPILAHQDSLSMGQGMLLTDEIQMNIEVSWFRFLNNVFSTNPFYLYFFISLYFLIDDPPDN
jgi:hypothetical protein